MFKAILLDRVDQANPKSAVRAELAELDESALPSGNVRVRIEYSSLNFKDALAISGRGAIAKKLPLVPGIDLAGVVERSDSASWKVNDRVVINGWGIGETHWGGLSQLAHVSSDWLLAIPEPYGSLQAMAVGTAGYTAALCVMALQRHGLTPSSGPVLVTGSTGGVGSIATVLLAGLGYEVIASTGRLAETDYLTSLGAAQVIQRDTLSSSGKALQSERWAGVVDTVGSHTLANACASTKWNGAVAACGLAQGADFPATVMPFILRGVTLYGINCIFIPNEVRRTAWGLLAQHLSIDRLASMTTVVGLGDAIGACSDLLDGKLRGRTVVDVNRT